MAQGERCTRTICTGTRTLGARFTSPRTVGGATHAVTAESACALGVFSARFAIVECDDTFLRGMAVVPWRAIARTRAVCEARCGVRAEISPTRDRITRLTCGGVHTVAGLGRDETVCACRCVALRSRKDRGARTV